jgi:peptide/nickel transport system permease protein
LVAGVTLVGLIVVIGLLGPHLSPYDPLAVDLSSALLPSSRAHWLGTDQFGRDLLTRIVYAIRVDIPIVVLSTVSSLGVGLLLGSLAGYYGGWIDAVVSGMIDVLIAVPYLVLVLGSVAVVGPGTGTIYLAIVIVGWVAYARIMHAQIRMARTQQYVEAARAVGNGYLRVLGRHVLPNTIHAALVYAMGDLVLNLHLLAALSFLGLGVQPPTPEWGAMVADGQSFVLDAWGLSTWPGVAVALVGISFSLVGDGLGDALDPRLRR